MGVRPLITRLLQRATDLFALWVVVGGGLALVRPAWFTWFAGQWIVFGLAAIMLGMGITLTLDDVRGASRSRCLRRWRSA